MALARLSDLNVIRARATAAAYRFIDDSDWPMDRIMVSLIIDAEAAGFDPEDPQLLYDLRLAAHQGRAAAVEMKRHKSEPYG